MKLIEFQQGINNLQQIRYVLLNDQLIPGYFHITEIGKFNKTFIDCGNTFRKTEKVLIQIWPAQDYDH